MIKPLCSNCGDELEEPGALVFSPPNRFGLVQKYHLCVTCFSLMSLDDLE